MTRRYAAHESPHSPPTGRHAKNQYNSEWATYDYKELRSCNRCQQRRFSNTFNPEPTAGRKLHKPSKNKDKYTSTERFMQEYEDWPAVTTIVATGKRQTGKLLPAKEQHVLTSQTTYWLLPALEIRDFCKDFTLF